MDDPLAEVVMLLQPSTPSSKLVSGNGRWAVQRTELGGPFYCVVLEGRCRLTVRGREPMVLERDDFVLIPAAFEFEAASLVPPDDHREVTPTRLPNGEIRHGDPHGPADVRMVIGYCAFGSPDADLLVSLLPDLIHVRGQPKFSVLVELVREEARTHRAARELVLSRLLEILFVEALRSLESSVAPAGLLRGLADEGVGIALRCLHERPAEPWTVAELASRAAMSRSSFFERFQRTVGVAPMEYLTRWRMALAKDLLRTKNLSVGQVAERVGYRSSSTFSIAFSRQVGRSPTSYAQGASTKPQSEGTNGWRS